MVIIEIQGIGWDLSMTINSYKLTERTTKTEKFEKSLKMYNIINFKTSCSSKIVHLLGN